ncbi:MAG: hypothetical protein A3F82_08675 [Deltaproteobacteria bacterium RIFCSPLOWO2_12_FULL_44_12]|nr:MAG: hypothetical protein A2712_00460 [Deltaproteobacteria bacterium RIFCSPHIGHO2_01_FULL_43_49]OGQ14253.1 MAG: hypothetical protein A3D22_10155 [Deltaproteobacteria bacterium RIFCSPHIGHO2_02_FULL_44_53]OGQ27469.1 MAG: hypothetical protein A3D98_03755 [Deltaproteobacteria bacterium RIFCSPHIGHO2_12_FULL_44_21]OGQ30717.1 MAG: hypothetical protein A2979_06180 [Deltaproteobacteria bacterium RIFCSPLOWO2_01_FULL_45_74]OGQ42394.1 MAG: hypothetical protein A3I70_02665 [Deltaproteobacteria bacterium 
MVLSFLLTLVYWISNPLFAQSRQVGQIDATNFVERVTVSNDGKLYAWDKEGKIIAGWPKDFSQENRFFILTPRLVDTDYDLQEEIVSVSKAKDGGDLKLHVFKGNGQEIQSWSQPLPENDLTATPILADVNHDSLLDIVFQTQSRVYIYRRDFQKIKDFSFEPQPFVAVGDSDNNGLEDLFIVIGSEIKYWSPSPLEGEGGGEVLKQLPLPTGSEKIIDAPIFVDVNRDLYPDLIYTTQANHLVAVDKNGNQLLNILMPEGQKIISGVVAEDIDLDREPELIVLSETQDILAFETNGTQVIHWREPLLYRQPLPTGGVVANDLYEGLFSTATGWDLYSIYRNKLEKYSHILLGENIHDWDSKADFNFVEGVKITDAFAFPKLFTPNGDGVNDSVQVHYRLSDEALISLDLYDAHERFISRVMTKQSRSAGEYQETFSGIDTKGTFTPKDDTPLDTGTYIIKVVAQSKEGFITSSKVNVIVNGIKAEIESPQEGAGVFGKITVSGIATDPNFGENNLDADFKAYKLYYRPGVWNITPDEVVDVGKVGSGWLPLIVPLRNQCPDNAQNESNDLGFPNSNVSCRPVQHGELGTFDTTTLSEPGTSNLELRTQFTPNGDYTLLLKVLDSNGNTIGKVNYDTTIVSVHNALATDPLLDPNDLFDPRNPLNPIYQGPRIITAPLSNALISRENPSTTISYTLANETSNIHIDIFPYNNGSLGAAVSAYSFNKQAPASYNFVWNGTNTLGRNVDGGHYKIRITANAIDGTGVAIDESLEFDVARGFSARDILAINSFTATPDHINPFGFGADLEPEKTTLSFALTKDAKVTLQVFNAKPEEGGVLQKTLLADQIRKTDSVLWDGSADNGIILTADRDYVVRLTATGIDLGNDEKAIKDIVVHLEQLVLDSGLTAKLNELKGDEKEDFVNNGTLYSMAGSPDFIWRSVGSGYVEVPFNYQISAYGEENYTQTNPNTVKQPVYQCRSGSNGVWAINYSPFTGGRSGPGGDVRDLAYPPDYESATRAANDGFGGVLFREITVGNSLPIQSFDVIFRGSGARIFTSQETYSQKALTLASQYTGDLRLPSRSVGEIIEMPANSSQLFPNASDSPLFQNGSVRFYYNGTGGDGSGCVNTGQSCGYLCGYSDGEVLLGPVPVYTSCDGGFFGGCPGWVPYCPSPLYPNGPRPNDWRDQLLALGGYIGGYLHQCGEIEVTTHGSAQATRSWPIPGQSAPTTSSNKTLNSLSLPPPNTNLVSYSASIGSGQTDVIDSWITGYNLGLSDTVNGYPSSSSSNGSTIVLPALAGWLSGGTLQAETRDNYGNRITEFKSDRDDPYTLPVPYRKIWGWHRGFNKDQFHYFTRPINFYNDVSEGYPAQGYVPNVWGQDPERNLYTFSNVVHLTDWQIEVRYPNVSVDKEDGDNPLDAGTDALNIFHVQDVAYNSGVREPRNGNIEDTFRLKLLPEAQPKRFVEIVGSASSNYELYYYDASKENPSWVKIPPRTHNAVANDILAHWDVTKLNGKNYTLVLKTKDPNSEKVNQDTFNIGIGHKVDTSELNEGEFARVDSTFKRSSLIFGPGSLSQPELITINPVPKNEADFRLPSGVAPLGPIFDIKPDNIQIDPSYHVQLELVFTPEEIRDVFGVADASDLQIYNLAGDELLEGLVTIAQLDIRNVSDPTDDVYRFTANLEHFSQYFLARKQFAKFKITSPRTDEYLKGIVNIQGQVEQDGQLAPIQNLTIRYGETFIHTGNEAQFDIPWDVSNLDGSLILVFEAQNDRGETIRHELPVAIDNNAGQSTLLVNGQAVADGGSITAGHDSVVEIKASDEVAGVAKIEYVWDGETFIDYFQPLTIPFTMGTHTIVYRATDKNGNVETPRFGTVKIQETLDSEVASQTSLALSLSGPNYVQNNQQWVTGETLFTIAASGGSLTQIKYRAGSATYQAYLEPFDLSGGDDGLYTIDYYAVDANGLRGDVQSRQVVLDSTPPVTTVVADGQYQKFGNVFIVTPETQIILKAFDDGIQPVGVARMEYRFDNDPWSVYRDPLRTSNPSTSLGAGLERRTLSYRSIDHLGNIELEKSVELKLDDVAPTLLVSGVPNAISPNGDGRKDTIEFLVFATDNFSKELFVNFVLVGSDGTRHVIWDRKPYEDKLVWDGYLELSTSNLERSLLSEGLYTYEIKVSDSQGNLSETKTGNLVYDITPPQVTLLGGQVLNFSPNGDLLSDILQVGYQIGDNLANQDIQTELHLESPEGFEIKEASDLVAIPPAEHQFSWDGTNLAENPAFDGTYRFKVIAEDPAGNRSKPVSGESQEASGEIFIDRLPPRTFIDVTGPWFVDKERKSWLANDSRILLSATDPVPASGVQKIQYTFGDAAFQDFAGPFRVPMENIDYTLRFLSLDNLGNKEQERSLQFRLDKTAPATTITIGEPKIGDFDTAWISPTTPITLEAQDPDGVGIKDIFVETPEVDETLVYDKPFSLVGLSDGLKFIYYWAKDHLDNEEFKKLFNINLDGTPPITKLIIGDPKVPDEGFVYVTSATPFDFETKTERNDLDKTQYKINEEDWKIAGPFQIPTEGDFQIHNRGTDTLGNIEPTNTQRVVVDNTPPDPLMALNQGDGDQYVTRQTKISLDGNTTGVGNDITEYRIDDGPWQLYKGPFDVIHLGAGSHTVTWRAKDKLGNLSPEKKFVAQLIDVMIERQDFAMPRTLVYLLQTFDLRPEDPRPNADFLVDLLKEMGGYFKITDNLDEFIHAMRSDKFTTFIFATDSLVVNFADEDEKVIRTLKELKSRIDKGEAFINLAGFSQMDGKPWQMFKENWSAGDGEPLSMLSVVSDLKSAARHHRYGDGHIVEVTANAGLVATNNDAAAKAALADLIEYVRPKEDKLNAGEVVDSKLTFTNSGDQDVVVDVKEIFPSGGLIETASTGSETPVDTRSYKLKISALDKVSIDYLYRMPFEVRDQKMATEIVATWKTGVMDKAMLEVPYKVEKDLNALMASVNSVLSSKSQVLSSKADSRIDMLDSLLGAIDATPRNERETQLNLDEALESAQLSKALEEGSDKEKSENVNEPTSFHGPTASYVKGNCQLNANYVLSSKFEVLGFMLYIIVGYGVLVFMFYILRRRMGKKYGNIRHQ